MIDWSKAPEWANYAAMHEDGEWYWYEREPRPVNYEGYWINGGKSEFITASLPNWRNSLTERPKD